jgi:hypothetical protein
LLLLLLRLWLLLRLSLLLLLVPPLVYSPSDFGTVLARDRFRVFFVLVLFVEVMQEPSTTTFSSSTLFFHTVYGIGDIERFFESGQAR